MKIVVVGGGSAGWITASYLKNNLNCELTVIDGNERPISGVGESTTPAILKMVTNLKDWKDKAKATYKYGIKFNNWHKINSVWYHLFDDAFVKNGIDSIEYLRNEKNLNTISFNKFHGSLIDLCISDDNNPLFNTIPGYGYHVQSDKLGEALKNQMKNYTLIKSDVKHIVCNEKGIEYLLLENNDKIFSDIYFDCTGFERKLISKLSNFEPYTDMIANKFITGKIKKQYRPYTVANALKHGWMWEIDTQDKTNAGFVYNSEMLSDDEAVKESGLNYEPRKFTSGKMKNIALKNCVSNGLAQSFIEPLEATSIMMTSVTVEQFVKTIKRNKDLKILDKVMNRFINHTKTFVKYHYVLSKRNDSKWWNYWTNEPNHIEDFLNQNLKIKRYCKKNDTLINHFNIASMMVGYECFN